MPHLCEFYPGTCLTTEEKARKNLSQGSRRVTVYIRGLLEKYPTFGREKETGLLGALDT